MQRALSFSVDGEHGLCSNRGRVGCIFNFQIRSDSDGGGG